jgi:pyruvate/2-oxoglutarate/acetoin dehydrogenase E1 component
MLRNKKVISFSQSINNALITAMKRDKRMLCYGLGITDPKGIFGTTLNLEELFGRERVFDIPCSENALTGVAIGASLAGMRSVFTHQRLDFFLLAMDQLVNSAAKWYYMFGGQISVPITIRLIIGRGWGQGPTHSQNLQAWFAHIPGLKVVMPSTPQDARDLLLDSIFDPNPVIFLEHRWLHNVMGSVTQSKVRKIIGKAKIVKKGNHITVVAMSYLVNEAIIASNLLFKYHNIKIEVIDLRTIKPIDFKLIFSSLKKTQNLLVLDTGHLTGSVSGEIISTVASKKLHLLKSSPRRLATPDISEPTSYSLTKNFHVDSIKIVNEVLDMFKIKKKINYFKKTKQEIHHDQPNLNFSGPF